MKPHFPREKTEVQWVKWPGQGSPRDMSRPSVFWNWQSVREAGADLELTPCWQNKVGASGEGTAPGKEESYGWEVCQKVTEKIDKALPWVWETEGSVRSAAAAVHQAMKLLPGPGKPETKNIIAHSDQKLFNRENRHITPHPIPDTLKVECSPRYLKHSNELSHLYFPSDSQ